MRVLKSFLNMVSLKLIWQRITFSKITTSFFILALAHCIVQSALQGFAMTINVQALDFLRYIVAKGSPNGSVPTGVAVFNTKTQQLTLCAGVPSTANCHLVWSAQVAATEAQANNTASPYTNAATSSTASATPTTDAFTAGGVIALASSAASTPAKTVTVVVTQQPEFADADNGSVGTHSGNDNDSSGSAVDIDSGGDGHGPSITLLKRNEDWSSTSITRIQALNATSNQFAGVHIQDPRIKGGNVTVSANCVASLLVPIDSLLNSRRVDLTFIAFQVWVLGMSFVALLNESVPHILASLLTHLLATAWSVYEVTLTAQFRTLVTQLVVDGPCHANLLPDYWGVRRNAEISIAVLNAVMLLAIGFLSYKLVKSFGWQTFKRVGASLVINRVYRLVLGFSISIQLSIFVMGANLTLWIDQLYNGSVAPYSVHRVPYEVVSITVLCILLPWLTMGWFAVRRENRFWMHMFLCLGSLMIFGWILMFSSHSFRYTFVLWDFFATVTVVATVLLALTLGLGTWCRLNFGRGLPRHLHAEEPDADEPRFDEMDTDSIDFDDEKKGGIIAFPDDSPLPTFAAAFGTSAPPMTVAAPSQAHLGALPGISMHGHSRNPSADASAFTYVPGGSETAAESTDGLQRAPSSSSTSSSGSSRSQRTTNGKRWVIE